MEPGRSVTPGPPQGTIEGAPSTQTPSQAEHGLGGRFALKATKGGIQVSSPVAKAE